MTGHHLTYVIRTPIDRRNFPFYHQTSVITRCIKHHHFVDVRQHILGSVPPLLAKMLKIGRWLPDRARFKQKTTANLYLKLLHFSHRQSAYLIPDAPQEPVRHDASRCQSRKSASVPQARRLPIKEENALLRRSSTNFPSIN